MMIYEPITLLLFLFTLQNGVNSFTIYDARLGSSSTSPARSGRVEVLTQRGWMPICTSRYSWDSTDSRVLCRQLGYSYSSYSSGSSSVNTLQYSFSCSGTESSISQCRYTFSSERQTTCSYAITVYCSSCVSGSVQLRGGVVPEVGTVEYCVGGTWRAVCDNGWDYKDSFVVCRRLGFPATDAIPYQNSYFGVHPFPTTTYFNCFGNETSLSNCQSSTGSSSSCGSEDAAGVHCKGDVITDLCINGHIRLAGGRDTNEGRVEICSNGVWGTIWGGGWDSRDAIVACRQLGLYQPHSRVEVFRGYNHYFGTGSGPILFAYLDCGGTESRLSDCTTSSSYYFGASHSSDAGVRCQRTTVTIRSNCANGDARLMNGTAPYEGRVEICYDGVWGSVCDHNWHDWDAAIVCLQRGFQGTNATALYNSYFGDGEGPYHLSGLNCRGNERTLLNCPRSSSRPIGYHTCSPGNDAGVRCDASMCNHGEVRWRNVYSNQYGTAEVCVNGQWANICPFGSDRSSISRTFCRQLIGEQSLSFGTSGGYVTGTTTLYSITCTGQTGVFTQDCTYSIIPGYSVPGCNLRSSMRVGCYESSSCEQGDVRLVDGNSTFEGRVEVCTQGLWGAITYESWNSNDAEVVCRQLGLPWEWALAVTSNVFGRGSHRIVARYVRCTGAETQLSSCSNFTVSLNSGTNYQTYTPAGVICQGITTLRPTECSHGDVRLVNGSRETEGRVEVCAYGYWAIACDGNSYWNTAATRLVCKQLGLHTEASEYLSGSPFGSNYQLPLVGLYCSSRARNVSQCQIYNQTSYCNHRRTVGVFCKEREYYQVEIHVSPPQESHEIGSRVTFNCTAISLPQIYQDFMFPLAYRWYYRGSATYTSTNTLSPTISSYEQSFGNYYCLIYNRVSNLILGQGRTTLNVKGVLKPNMNVSSPVKIQTPPEQRSITFQVNTLNHNVVDLLLGLTWYHNGSKIISGDDPNLIQSNGNKTLTISAFSSNYYGIYKAQFDQLFVYPFDEACKDEVLSLTRHYPLLKPAVFCVNMDDDCSDSNTETQVRKISIQFVDSVLQGTLDNITLVADARVLSRKELQHSSIYWYRNGGRIYGTSSLQKHYNTLSLSQRFQQFNIAYGYSGRYEVQLRININTYLRAGDATCLPYYNRFVSRYLGSTVTLAKGFIDIDYYKGLTVNLDVNKEATTRNEGATLTCQASIEFPPFSMLSLIKNGQTLSSSSNGSLEIDTRNIDANQFGLYICQLNASGVISTKSYTLKEQANLRMTLDIKNSNICSNSPMAIEHVEETLVQKIKRECQCSFNLEGFQNSTVNCESSSELTYVTILEYSDREGSEIASIIAKRLVDQAPFSMAVEGTQLSVTSACADCEMPTTELTKATSLSPAMGGGLFIGGFLAAIFIAVALVIIVILAVKKCTKSESNGDRRFEVKTDTLRYTCAGAAHQNVDLSFKEPAAEYMTPHPKMPSEYQAIGPRDQPSQYETMQFESEQPIYEQTF